MNRSNISGFSLVEAVMILGVTVLLAGLGFVAWKSFVQPSQVASETSKTPSVSSEAQVRTIKSVSDLDKAASTLDTLELDDADLEEAELQANL